MNNKVVGLGELFKDFTDYLSVADILAAKTLTKISVIISKSRIDMGMNQKEFAEFMEVSQSMVSKWESEDYNFTIETLAKICEKLNLQLDIEMKSSLGHYKNLFKSCNKTKINNNWDLTPNLNMKHQYSEAV